MAESEAREWQCKLCPHVETSYTKKNNATRHVQTTHLNFKYLCNICQAITNRRDDHRCKKGGNKTNIVLFNTISKIQSKEAEIALKKINLDYYLSTTIIKKTTS